MREYSGKLNNVKDCEDHRRDNCISMNVMIDTYQHLMDEHECTGFCRVTEFKGKISKLDVPKSGKNGQNWSASVGLGSTAQKEIIFEEYKIYDFFGMVGSIGGSLGLLLGFSFFGILSDLIDVISQQRTEKLCK